jgi:hypothetical protein
MASLKFYATEVNASNPGGTLIPHGLGSGLGFYGAGYGVSVPIAGRQDTTWLTNSDGTASQRIQLNNTKYTSSGTVSINGAEAVALDRLPNNKCPLNIRFEHDSAVRVQNCKLRIFDRNNINNQASGVATYVYEARHPSSNQAVSNLSQRGRDANSWYEFDPVEAMTDMPLTPSPGMSGVNTNTTDTDPVLGYLSQQGVSHASTRHDWYGAISAEPDSIGSKTNYALYVSCEYL